MWVGVTIYEQERILRQKVNEILKLIRDDGAKPHYLAHYSQTLRELHEAQDIITSLEEHEDS